MHPLLHEEFADLETIFGLEADAEGEAEADASASSPQCDSAPLLFLP